jgi:chromosome segregation ATPase
MTPLARDYSREIGGDPDEERAPGHDEGWVERAVEAVTEAAKLELALVPRELGPRARVEALEDHILVTANAQAGLGRARLEVHDQLRLLEEEWDHLEGWEMARRTRTNAGVEDAKRQLKPALYDGIKRARWLVKRLTEQIDRLEGDFQKCSRAYTIATGA